MENKLKYGLAGAVVAGVVGLSGLLNNIPSVPGVASNKKQDNAITEESSMQKNEETSIEYNGLLWESKCFNNREWLYYNQSDAQLKKKGMRHPYFWESGELICAGLEGKLKDPIKKVYDDYYSEWQNCGMVLKGKEIVIYLDPVFDYGDNGYSLKSYGEVLCISSENAKLGWNKIVDLGDEASKIFYGRPINKLPLDIQKRGETYLCDQVQPMGRGCGRYFVNCYNHHKASRGVRSIKNTPQIKNLLELK